MSENALVIPEHQRSRLHPRRGGGTPAAPAAIDAGAAERLRDALTDSQERAERLLRHGESVRELVEPARAHLDGSANPTGAAVLAAAAAKEFGKTADLADAWAAEHGLAFAAGATAALARIRVEPDGGGRGRRLQLVRHDDHALMWRHADAAFDDVAPRVRALIAAAGDEQYREVVTVLAQCRQDLIARIATAFLVPSKTGWVDDLCAELPDDPAPCLSQRVMCSLGTADQVAKFRTRAQPWERLVTDEVLYTAADGLGPALVPLLTELIDCTADPLALEVMGILPSDEALKALVERLDRPGVHAAAVEAAERFPERARRAFQDAVDSSPGEIARFAARLLGGTAEREAGWAADAALEDLPSVLADPPWARGLPDRKPAVVKGLEPPAERTVIWEPGERERWAALSDVEEVGWEKVIDLVRDMAAVPPAATAELLFPFCDAGIAARMAEWRLRRPALSPVAERWFARHAAAAARMLVPAALSVGKKAADRRARRDAETALVHLASHGHADDALAAGREHGAEAAAGIEALVALDPMVAALPAEIPKAPYWLDPHLIPQVLLRDGRALPAASVGHLVTLLTVCEPDDVHPGVKAVREACAPASLDAFAWKVFELSGLRERGGGAGLGDEAWVMAALGLLGQDATARDLTPVIRKWPGMNGNRMAVAGLDVLAAIGTDTALGELNAIAEQIRYKGLRGQARDRIATLAAHRGLTTEQLADRLVPDLGLDAAGTLVLDYGPRRFTVGFDERLKPFVLGEDGERRASLPKPGARDEAELALAAYKRFTELKKAARATAAPQLERLERAMVAGRCWSAGDFRALILGHPLLQHVARRLLWTTGGPTFRITEDRSLADVDGAEPVLSGTGEVGIVHPLHMSADELAAWSDVFGRYEIVQPFPQIARPVHTLTEDERAGHTLDRFHGLTVTTGAAQGMDRRGWTRGVPQDNGIIFWISRSLPGDRTVVLDLDPGISVVTPGMWPEQRIKTVGIISGDNPFSRPGSGSATFADLDEVNASELLTDLLHLTESGTAT
ncbi:DUF4132 domain-containing protein [Spirillospora sp. CA-108201]